MSGQVVTQPFLPSPFLVALDGVTLGGSQAPGVAAWPSANRAIFVPFSLPVNQRLKSMSCHCTTTNSANFDLGLYDPTGVRLGSLGSTALAAGVNTWTPTSPILLLAGTLYFAAMAAASSSSTFARTAASVVIMRGSGAAQQASALALPSTATYAVVASAYLPLLVLNFVETPV